VLTEVLAVISSSYAGQSWLLQDENIVARTKARIRTMANFFIRNNFRIYISKIEKIPKL